jgi:hypothetical protein
MTHPLRLLPLLLLAVAAQTYSAAVLSTDEQTLTLVTPNGRARAPKTQPDQVGFTSAQLSADHQLAGWLTLVPNCCTSYPIPSTLVIVRNGKVVQQFREELPIFRWAFSAGSTAVAYQGSTVHGCAAIFYKLRRISDGKTLGTFECNCESGGARLPVPEWVWPVAWECPEQQEGHPNGIAPPGVQ